MGKKKHRHRRLADRLLQLCGCGKKVDVMDVVCARCGEATTWTPKRYDQPPFWKSGGNLHIIFEGGNPPTQEEKAMVYVVNDKKFYRKEENSGWVETSPPEGVKVA